MERSQSQLYNLKNDIGESKNIAAQFPERVKELEVLRKKWDSELIDPIFFRLDLFSEWQKKMAKNRKKKLIEEKNRGEIILKKLIYFIIIFTPGILFSNEVHPLHYAYDKQVIEINPHQVKISQAINGNKIITNKNGLWEINSSEKIKMRAVGGLGWDVSSKLWLCVDIHNEGVEKLMVVGMAFSGWKNTRGAVVVEPGHKKTLAVYLPRKDKNLDSYSYLYGDVIGLPNGSSNSQWRELPLSKLENVDLEIYSDSTPKFNLSNFRAAGAYENLEVYNLCPCNDRLWIHMDKIV